MTILTMMTVNSPDFLVGTSLRRLAASLRSWVMAVPLDIDDVLEALPRATIAHLKRFEVSVDLDPISTERRGEKNASRAAMVYPWCWKGSSPF